MPVLQLTEINIYPVKSLGGISLTSALTMERGLQYDRRWMLIDENNRFISQRELPEMALLGTSVLDNQLSIYRKNNPDDLIILPAELEAGEVLNAVIWNDECKVLHYSVADSWIQNTLNNNCRLVYMPDFTERKVNPEYAINDEIVSFADGYPFLILSEETLNDLNQKLQTPVPMNRFRPNFVFKGGNAFEEDTLGHFKMGEAEFATVKPCGRCMITTVDQDTAEKSKEPLKTLATYRTVNNSVNFGQNLVLVKPGIVTVGDLIVQKNNIY